MIAYFHDKLSFIYIYYDGEGERFSVVSKIIYNITSDIPILQK